MLKTKLAPVKKLRAEVAEACVQRLAQAGSSRAIGIAFEKYDASMHDLSRDRRTLKSKSRFSFKPVACSLRCTTGCHRWSVSITSPFVSIGVMCLHPPMGSKSGAQASPQVCVSAVIHEGLPVKWFTERCSMCHVSPPPRPQGSIRMALLRRVKGGGGLESDTEALCQTPPSNPPPSPQGCIGRGEVPPPCPPLAERPAYAQPLSP